MKRIESIAYARAGLVGNPSDGYFGKTLALSIRNLHSSAVIYDWPTLEILPSEQDLVRFKSYEELMENVRQSGYYGGLRLVKASLKKFHDYCTENNIRIPERNFTIRYDTGIPRQVGLAGSSAIITATFRCLMEFYEIDIPKEVLPNWVLATEHEELGISAGLQDRVCQTYEGLVYMDFKQEKMERDGYGFYENLDPALLPPLYLAYRVDLSKVSGVVHSNLRQRWERGDSDVLEAMKEFACLTDRARDCLLSGRHEELGEVIDANFDLRRKILPITEDNIRMVETARSCGVSAKFAGSGGAIIGICPNGSTFDRLSKELSALGCRVIRPRVE